ncbi:hypothetical protein B0A52_08284 [Exophiala mesophila]|uniref:PH domain-containing protein n=1 Tax=Exophiala mesophila TaxID=212818 RepID=A0A438MYE9_EXOME|nr:hypothetical protein B0A52_08284 [Exophiala mesophila]
MATAAFVDPRENASNNTLNASFNGLSDPFLDNTVSDHPVHSHRYSALIDSDTITLGASTSPAQVKRSLEAHISETERRLQDAQKLGQSLLQQQADLQEKLLEVDRQQGDAEISPGLRQQLTDLEKEHNDIGKEIARALLGPKSRAVSGEERPTAEPSTFSSQATASPTKVSAPSRRSRNQPSNRAGDLQFAADISTSLLAQVRQLQSAVAERDDLLKQTNSERERLERDNQVFAQRLRALDENEQKYKDENWNLETQTHQLLADAREASDREKKLRSTLAAITADKSRSEAEAEELRLNRDRLADDLAAAKKAHDSELHTLKRTIELGDGERTSLQTKVDELTSQNTELARAIAARLRSQHSDADLLPGNDQDGDFRDVEALDDSPPPSPTKATPRHGGLESETMRSSLHHAHRMIQNLKNNIHREKTEKIELKRMLQDARDELEQRRGDGAPGSGSKRQRTKADPFKKPVRPDMLGNSRRSRTDIEMDDEDWEDHAVDTPSHSSTSKHLNVPFFATGRTTDASDAYQTATENEAGAFETADERHTTESEDFQTGAESLAGDSTDDLTETEDNASHLQRKSRAIKPSPLSFKPAGDRQSFVSTASTSAGEDEDELKTPVVTQTQKFRLRNGGRQSVVRQSQTPTNGTPTNVYAGSSSFDSPATMTDRSPPGAEQSLFAELGELDDSNFGTPGRSSIISAASTPGVASAASRRTTLEANAPYIPKPVMVDSGVMTEPWQPEPPVASEIVTEDRAAGPSTPIQSSNPSPMAINFPLPPTVPNSPFKHTDNGTQYTPQRALQDSPLRNTAFITPPKTVWDEAQSPEHVQPEHDPYALTHTPQIFGFSGLLTHETRPVSPDRPQTPPPVIFEHLNFSDIHSEATEPVQTPIKSTSMQLTSTATQVEDTPGRLAKAEKLAGAGILASAAAAMGLAKAKSTSAPTIAEDETSEPDIPQFEAPTEKDHPLKDVSGNSLLRKSTQAQTLGSKDLQMSPIARSHNDQSSQTMLTAAEIESALHSKTAVVEPLPPALTRGQAQPHKATRPIIVPAPIDVARASLPADPPVSELDHDTLSAFPLPSPIKRPSSASSQRLGSATIHPPLPPDHKAAIARASSRVASPTRDLDTVNKAPTIMGPPAIPASAMRRPKTPSDSIRSPTREGNGPRTSNVSRFNRGTVASQTSRRSSVSSFASEIDVRFNMQPNATPGPHTFGTDPRIIQAITQTMIGEFLWKYTRKTGRSEMSETRHRRYFWVHPYTRTLYWSDQDPQTAGRAELKAKSVLIESVEIVNDDNPMPPGLHRKSLEVVTPGRRVRFTASTGQRHETWYNALKYLLVRGEDTNGEAYTAGNNEITRDDVNEFNVNAAGYGATLVPNGSRMSLSSYNSRTTRGSVIHRPSAAHGISSSSANRLPEESTASRTAPNSTVRRSRADQPQDGDRDRTVRASSTSRFSRMMSSVTGRTPRASEAFTTPGRAASDTGSIYDASVVSDGRRDSAEEMRQEMLRQEQIGFGGLENVRACCDGKHDVSTLTHAHRHASSASHSHRGVSMSFRGSARRSNTNSTLLSNAQTPTRATAS